MPEPWRPSDPGDIDTRAIRRGALAIVMGIVFALVAAYAGWRLLQAVPGSQGATERLPQARPLLQDAPQNERAAYFAAKERRLRGYGWVDRKAGIAHIPVDEAMRLMAARPAPGKEAP